MRRIIKVILIVIMLGLIIEDPSYVVLILIGFGVHRLIKYLSSRRMTRYFKKGTLHLSCVDSMNGKQFEKLISDLLPLMRFNSVVITKQTNDYGVDILAKRNGIKYAIQCKRASNKVTNKAVQEVYAGINYYSADRGLVITNNYFTLNAKRLARSNGIELWDRDVLIENLGAVNVNLDHSELKKIEPTTNLPNNDYYNPTKIEKYPAYQNKKRPKLYCVHCGGTLDDGGKCYISSCGSTKFGFGNRSTSIIFCSFCGDRLTKRKFCQNCGNQEST